jgi:signal transduction histidine kinase
MAAANQLGGLRAHMTKVGQAAGPFGAALAGVARSTSLNIRLTVLVCMVLIAGSFAAAAALEMRLDRVHALAQAEWYERQRAIEIAAVADAALDRLADAGRAFADQMRPATSGVRNIAVFDASGVWGRVMHGSALNFPDLPPGWFAASNRRGTLIGSSLLAFPYKGQVVAVHFDPVSLVPRTMLGRAALIAPDERRISDRLPAAPDVVLEARAAHWPLTVQTSVDTAGALAAWYGALPLYLFVILGPALAGACLAALFVGEFERRAKASAAVRAIRSARPLEGRLLVRLAHAERAAHAATRSKSEFIAHMSHELRTPLNAIIGFSEVIATGLFGPAGHPKYVEYAHDIAIAGRGLHAKIGDILEYANVEAGRHPLRPTRFDLCHLAGASLKEHAGLAFSRRITLELGDVESAAVFADSSAAMRIATILLSNALLYTPEGGRVRIDVRGEVGSAVLALKDSGAGFSGAEATAATNAFSRFDRAGARTGTGLGLAIAAALARRMGGALTIGGTHGEGGLTELRLPRA